MDLYDAEVAGLGVKKPTGRSWVEGANEENGFGLNHLPYGVFRAADGKARLCVRLGDWLLDLAGCAECRLLDLLSAEAQDACGQPYLNSLLALGPDAWKQVRDRVGDLLGEAAPGEVQLRVEPLLRPVAEVELLLPIAIGNYTDFYASVDHARRVGEIFRPDQPLLPNYAYVPIGYHGRASSIVVSGTEVRRPWGQTRPGIEGGVPGFAPSAALDYEVELAFVVGTGNALGQPIAVAEAGEHLFGVALLNDWSARDIQAWEYQPLGPFLGKSFATSLSPWITPMAALEPFRVPARVRSGILEYLRDVQDLRFGGLDVLVRTSLSTSASRASGRPPMKLGSGRTDGLYWTAAQMFAHHTSNGCNLQPGDVLATGTISGPERESAGCLLERTRNGAEPLELANGERRAWLLDGDEVVLSASCERAGLQRIVLGSCVGRVIGAGEFGAKTEHSQGTGSNQPLS